MLETILVVISVLIIVLVLLQSNKAQAGGQIISGGNAELFQNQKERGGNIDEKKWKISKFYK